jgi:hypothetical protein
MRHRSYQDDCAIGGESDASIHARAFQLEVMVNRIIVRRKEESEPASRNFDGNQQDGVGFE